MAEEFTLLLLPLFLLLGSATVHSTEFLQRKGRRCPQITITTSFPFSDRPRSHHQAVIFRQFATGALESEGAKQVKKNEFDDGFAAHAAESGGGTDRAICQDEKAAPPRHAPGGQRGREEDHYPILKTTKDRNSLPPSKDSTTVSPPKSKQLNKIIVELFFLEKLRI